jgi:hypothetical protein
MIRTLVASIALVFVLVGAAPRSARADSSTQFVGFICNVVTSWSTKNLTSAIFSARGCSGTFLGIVSVVQAGTASSCPASSQPSPSELQTLTSSLVQQSIAGRAVQVFNTTLTNGAICTTSVNYLPN